MPTAPVEIEGKIREVRIAGGEGDLPGVLAGGGGGEAEDAGLGLSGEELTGDVFEEGIAGGDGNVTDAKDLVAGVGDGEDGVDGGAFIDEAVIHGLIEGDRRAVVGDTVGGGLDGDGLGSGDLGNVGGEVGDFEDDGMGTGGEGGVGDEEAVITADGETGLGEIGGDGAFIFAVDIDEDIGGVGGIIEVVGIAVDAGTADAGDDAGPGVVVGGGEIGAEGEVIAGDGFAGEGGVGG